MRNKLIVGVSKSLCEQRKIAKRVKERTKKKKKNRRKKNRERKRQKLKKERKKRELEKKKRELERKKKKISLNYPLSQLSSLSIILSFPPLQSFISSLSALYSLSSLVLSLFLFY
jgi:uncharacterized membrane protein (DUF106 family)